MSSKSVHKILSYLVHKQTHKPTNKPRRKHNLLGGGNYHLEQYFLYSIYIFLIREYVLIMAANFKIQGERSQHCYTMMFHNYTVQPINLSISSLYLTVSKIYLCQVSTSTSYGFQNLAWTRL